MANPTSFVWQHTQVSQFSILNRYEDNRWNVYHGAWVLKVNKLEELIYYTLKFTNIKHLKAYISVFYHKHKMFKAFHRGIPLRPYFNLGDVAKKTHLLIKKSPLFLKTVNRKIKITKQLKPKLAAWRRRIQRFNRLKPNFYFLSIFRLIQVKGNYFCIYYLKKGKGEFYKKPMFRDSINYRRSKFRETILNFYYEILNSVKNIKCSTEDITTTWII